MLAVGIVWPSGSTRLGDLGATYFFLILPVTSFILLTGWSAIGLRPVDTVLWGGVLVTIVVAAVGIVCSLPLGILLALGRRSRMPTVRVLSVIFIEFVRGVPLVTVLFMASVMLPLFITEQWSPDKLVRALVGIALFASAYMAEVVRAGLQAIPKGQCEGSMVVGLRYWQMIRLVFLPQALKVTIPNIVNTYSGLFKDTTLVFIVGIFDLLRTIEVSRIDPKWATPVTSTTGYAVAAIFYLVFCYGMSRYARPRRRPADERRSTLNDSSEHHGSLLAGKAQHRRCGRACRSEQVVRRFSRPARHQPQGDGRRTHRHLRAIWIGQVDDDPLHQPSGRAPDRPHLY
jgi:general L-amino acid transport system permease protein